MLLLTMQPHPSNPVLHHMGLLPYPHEMMEWESGCLEPSLLLWQCSFASPCKDRGTVVTYAKFIGNMSNTVGTKAFPSFARNKIWKCAWVPILMIHIGSYLLTCHLQVHPSQMQMPFSMRKGNLPKRSFPYNNVGYGNILLFLWLFAKNQTKCPAWLTSWVLTIEIILTHLGTTFFFCCALPGMPQICHGMGWGWELPSQCLQNLCQCWKVWRSLLSDTPFFWVVPTTLMITQAKTQLKHWSLVTKRLMTTVKQQLNTWFLCLNEFLASPVLGCT